MTATHKTVRRVTTGSYQFRGGERRPVVVSVEAGDVLSFRFKGTRDVFRWPIYSAALSAMRAAGIAETVARREARKAGQRFDGSAWRRANLR